jgi:hypothetical protein
LRPFVAVNGMSYSSSWEFIIRQFRVNLRIFTGWIQGYWVANSTLAAMVFLSIFGLDSAWAGPPFVTDDPVPVEFRHWEVYIASEWEHDKHEGTSGTLPHIEVNYGIITDVQLHMIVPMAYSAPHMGSRQYGIGDIELGVKYRFLHENGWMPQVGVFPLVELPTGDSSRGLGEGHVNVFLPVWIQKSWGPWSTYGGGGYWFHPGEGNENYWFAGWLLQRDLSKVVTLGAEIFNTSPKAESESDETGFNIGGFVNLSEVQHILFSAGRDLKGPNTFSAYLAFQWTFGPKEKNSNQR